MRSEKYRIRRIITLLIAAAMTAPLCMNSADAMFSSSFMDTGNVEISLNTIDKLRTISPYIYGLNSVSGISGASINALKQSDIRISSYNWENNYSNSGSGNGSENSLALVDLYSQERQSSPALYTDILVSSAERYGIPSRYVTLQMMGKVAPDSSDAPWETVVYDKNDSYLSVPDTEDGTVYMDEYVSFLVNKYGYAIDGGINGYFLDNEPENWFSRFPSAVSSPITASELVSRSSELAGAVKDIDPTALVYGPSVSGIDAFIDINNAGDREQYRNDYSWFIDYYLDGMKKASDACGTRLLDVLDVHYQTEATNGLLQPIINSNDNLSNNTRMQAPRILWDSSYTENSTTAIMHNQYIPLIPTLEASIDMYYPDTKLSFSEYNFGGGDNVSGGIAAADALGIFASYGVHMACMDPNSADIRYLKAALNLYTDYDGNGSGFGDTLIQSNNGNDIMSSVYAAVDSGDSSVMRTVILNKNQFSPKTAEISITSGTEFTSAEVYYFNSETSSVTRAENIESIENNSLSFEMEPLSAYILVFREAAEEILPDDPESGNNESTGTSVSGTGSDTATVSTPAKTSFVPEHVDASTYSSAAAPLPDESVSESSEAPVTETAAAISGSSVSEEISSEESSGSPNDENEPDKTVPAAVKAIISVLVAAVFIALFYVLISDLIIYKKKNK